MNKYRNVRTPYSGAVYDSRGEAEYARRLDLLLAAGRIARWRRGTDWEILERPNRIVYRPDFEVWRLDGTLEAHDFKGMETPVFKLKAKLFRARYPGVPLVVVRKEDVA